MGYGYQGSVHDATEEEIMVDERFPGEGVVEVVYAVGKVAAETELSGVLAACEGSPGNPVSLLRVAVSWTCRRLSSRQSVLQPAPAHDAR